jgi:L-lactate dehydrogenase complex protein LldE
MHFNSGYASEGKRLGDRLCRLLDGFDVMVAPSASCVGHLRTHHQDLVGRLYELSEFIVDRLGIDDVGAAFPHRVTYHPTCHSLRVTRVGDAPARLLRHVAGLELIDLSHADECCGFGGTFAIKNADTSSAILDDKCAAIAASGADYCVAIDGSCLLQIGGGLSRRGSTVRPIHLAEILARTD